MGQRFNATSGIPIDISRIDKYAPEKLIGRADETRLLDDAWDEVVRGQVGRPHVLAFVALGGEGKTSLVAKWAAELAHRDWAGCEAVFAWSFYSQGTRDQSAASSDLFLKEAITFFGDGEDKVFAASSAGSFEKGQRLARIVGSRRNLLILDGLEPLQYAPTAPTPGELKDQGLAALLKGLAADSHGLCVVTTRYSIPDLKLFRQTTVSEEPLLRLSNAAGVDLLQKLGVRKESGTRAEFEKLVEDVKGHALTLSLFGTYLRDAHSGDIRKRDRVKLAGKGKQGEHAFHVMDAYVRWFVPTGIHARVRCFFSREERASRERGQRSLAVLSLLGLFDRPAAADCADALRRAPIIRGLTEPLVGLKDDEWELSLTALREAKLLNVNREQGSGELLSIDAHPLLREYFAHRVREQQPEAWRAAHRRLYEYLCASTPDKFQPTLEDLQPLYQAVTHGCQAGLQQEVRNKVYYGRIGRAGEHYSTTKLGAFGSDLGAAACFFEVPWSRVSRSLTDTSQAWVLSHAAICLRALGRLTEALEPTRIGMEMLIKQINWTGAAATAGNLSELQLTLGDVAAASGDAEQAVIYADRSGDPFQRITNRASYANALHHAGHRAAARTHFHRAEQMQTERQPEYSLLYSMRGFQYCDLLLTDSERVAWQIVLESGDVSRRLPGTVTRIDPGTDLSKHSETLRSVSRRATKTLEWTTPQNWLLDIALDHLTLGRVMLYAAILEPSPSGLDAPRSELNAAVSGLRRSGNMDDLPRGLLTHAWLHSLEGQRTGPDSAHSDLEEAWEIAERGPMPLFLADIHLHRARLFFRETLYPWTTPAHDLSEAERLINKHGYHHRKEELADAKEAILPRSP